MLSLLREGDGGPEQAELSARDKLDGDFARQPREAALDREPAWKPEFAIKVPLPKPRSSVPEARAEPPPPALAPELRRVRLTRSKSGRHPSAKDDDMGEGA